MKGHATLSNLEWVSGLSQLQFERVAQARDPTW